MNNLESTLVDLGQSMHRDDQAKRKPKKRKAKKVEHHAAPRKSVSSGRIPAVRPGHVVGGFDLALERMSRDFNAKIEKALGKTSISTAPKRKAAKKKAKVAKAPAAPKKSKHKKKGKKSARKSKFQHGPVYGPTREDMEAGAKPWYMRQEKSAPKGGHKKNRKGPKKPRSAAQKAATARMLAAKGKGGKKKGKKKSKK